MADAPAEQNATSRLDLILIATLVTLVLHPPAPAYVVHYLQAAIVLGLLWPVCRWHPSYWLALAAAQFAYVWLDWYAADNHKYLAAYWCLALSISTAQADRAVAYSRLRTTAVLTVGLVMALAGAWKLATPEYRDGSFFEYELLTDDRFAVKVDWLLGVDRTELAVNRELLDVLTTDPLASNERAAVRLQSNARVASAAAVLTWTTAITELLLAGIYLVPLGGQRWQTVRDYSLLLFLIGTYLIAPVFGFGGLLAVMGATQAGTSRRQTAFLLMLAVLEVFSVTHRLHA